MKRDGQESIVLPITVHITAPIAETASMGFVGAGRDGRDPSVPSQSAMEESQLSALAKFARAMVSVSE